MNNANISKETWFWTLYCVKKDFRKIISVVAISVARKGGLNCDPFKIYSWNLNKFIYLRKFLVNVILTRLEYYIYNNWFIEDHNVLD